MRKPITPRIYCDPAPRKAPAPAITASGAWSRVSSSCRRRCLLVVIAALSTVVPVVGCGGGDEDGAKVIQGVDTSDPAAVVEAFERSMYSCGEKGAGLRYDLTVPDQREGSREAAIRDELESGCRPRRVHP